VLDGIDNRLAGLEQTSRALLGVVCNPALRPLLGLLRICP
jgi:hypothetical protein